MPEPEQVLGHSDSAPSPDPALQGQALALPRSRSSQLANSLPQATPYAQQLVKSLCRLDRSSVALTAEEAEQWRKNFDELVAQRADGVAGIAEFLQTNTDVQFGRAGKELIGFSSAREAMFDALVRIGGPEAVMASLQALQNTADPREVALLGRSLEKLAPEWHRQDVLNAARDVLGMAANGRLPDVDVAPLFEVLQTYGGSEVVTDLERAASHWEYYSAIALAYLPDGAGIPLLARMAEANGPMSSTALQLLAQVSGNNAQAQSALVAQAQANAIPASVWPFLVSSLAGNEYQFQNSAFAPDGRAHPGDVSTAHIRSGNQTFYSAFTSSTLTQEQINQRIAFINQLREVTSQPAAQQALQQAIDLLTKRLPATAL
ncbi:MAG: hypothetical protein L0Y58_07825 [Verrucomicrobia subdivision 3 bacterium]|nr:hypothetical protein [Limisphaerales bacterium]